MSVTFSPAMNDNVAWIITCICGDWAYNNRAEFPNYASANAAVRGGIKPACADVYCDYAYVQPAIAEPECQMANGNAVALFDALGLIEEDADFSDYCCGSLPAKDFLGRVLMAQAVAPVSAEIPTYREGNIITGGRREGYVQERLEQLREVAEWAIKNDREVVWG